MYKTVNLTLTEVDCLNMRMALNATAIQWGEKAGDYRKAGNDREAATCERIRSEYNRLWERVRAAQHAAQDAAQDARLAWFEPSRAAYPDKCGYVGCSFCDAENS
jgi:hypothetical protein